MERADPKIPVAGPWITDREVAAVAHAARHSWFEHAGDESRAFEQEFARATGRRHAIALPSCTSALHLSLLALGVGPGDEVIVPEATWIASVAPVIYVGATPVFVDVEPDTWCMSVRSLIDAVGDRTKAVITVDLYGGFPDMVALEQLAADRGIALIEDAAEAAGGRHAGRPAGSFGHTSTFSFHGSKTLTTGEGGMVLCDDDRTHERMLFLRDHGRLPGDVSFRSVEVAWKYKMSELQAALGRVQLDRIEELIERKRQIFGWYQERLAGCPLALNVERLGDRATYWMVTAVFDKLTSVGRATTAFADANISTRPFFPPLSSLPAFADASDVARARHANPVSYDLAGRALNLPSALTLDEGQVDRVCSVVRQICALEHGDD
ncbi:MAG TPA: DegT/DnrJ/EryC1/StrS family aminotransferase [Ilumatobacteraceae bacterium]|nr:DegT/DnrJ/EryC1/StrS family aminotransferase [Ilumatobacteraceae bacterium]